MQTCVLTAGRLFSVLVLLLGFSAAFGQTSLDALGEEDADVVSQIERLVQTRTSVEFADTPLNQVAETLAARLGVNVVLARRTLSDAAIRPDTPVTFKMHDVKVETILKYMLSDLKLTWIVRDGVIVITTPEEAESQLLTRLYPVLDLVTVRRATTSDGEIADYDTLIEVITTTIDPDSWDDVGGPGTIAEMPNVGVLVISQTREIHAKLEGLVAALRKAKAIQRIPSLTSPILVSRRSEVRSAPPPPRHYSSTPSGSWQLPRVHGAE